MKRCRWIALLLIAALLLPTLTGCDLFAPKAKTISKEAPVATDKKAGVSVAFDP